ncbi:MAG: hypothetical protein PHV37_02775 [Candidatus Gastranaerophilales bacterium]|nr:hypothetical protein [Candidatus Gastranaerophilales bacterium]
MAVASNQVRLLTLTARKSDLEYSLTSLMGKQQLLATQNADVLAQRTQVVESFVAAQLNSSDADQDTAPTIATFDSTVLAQFDSQLAQLEAAQNKLDLQQKKIETQHQAVTAEEESVQKAVDNSIKNEFNYMAD